MKVLWLKFGKFGESAYFAKLVHPKPNLVLMQYSFEVMSHSLALFFRVARCIRSREASSVTNLTRHCMRVFIFQGFNTKVSLLLTNI